MNSEAVNNNLPQDNAPIDAGLEAVAIIGMTGRFPGANNVEQFWQNVRDGVESVTHFSAAELIELGHDPELVNKPNYVKAKGIVADVDQFDAFFFGFSPREAEVMDPQHRLFLESAWVVLEQAGYDAPRYAGRIGVYAGVGANSYMHHNVLANREPGAMSDVFQMSIGNDKDFVPTRVSYQLNLTGPSINVNTGCSSALVAVSLAVQNLLTYQCDMALAGGVALAFPQKTGYLYQAGMVGSPDGHCRAFDAQAQGAVGGEGVGIVVLKRLEEALADGDTIHAVIRGCAINNDGANKIGYTAPSVDGQASVIAEAIAMAGVAPATISYVEAHGSGTALGDPIEVAALKLAFQTGTHQTAPKAAPSPATQYCALGSVKTNIGHTDTAAGVAGLIKTVQALKHRQLPPSLHYTQPNPQIDFANSPFYVNHTLQPWPRGTTPRRAGVSSFGIGGTNAHVVLEEAPRSAPSSASRAAQLLTCSAKTATALAQAVANLADHLQQQPALNLADVAFTLTNRRPFAYRYTIVAQNTADALAQLQRAAADDLSHRKIGQAEPRIAFMFSGQGHEVVNMGRELYAIETVFREVMDQCATLLLPHLGLDLRQVLYPADDKASANAAQPLAQPAIAQAALFATEYALAQLWLAWGIQPVALIGHGLGEYVAACLAGVFTLADALDLVVARGQLLQALPAGVLIDVPLSADAIRPYLNDQLALAQINEESHCVIAGTAAAVAALERALTDEGLVCRLLPTAPNLQSPLLDAHAGDFAQRLAQVRLQAPTVPYIANGTGTWISVADATSPAYWVRQLRQPIRFADGLATLSMTADLLLEVGPGSTLATFAQRHPDLAQATVVTSLCAARTEQAPEQTDLAHLLTTLGRLWQKGAAVDWAAYYANETRHRLPLPTYPFERKSYWVAPGAAVSTAGKSALSMANQRRPLDDWFYVPSWRHLPLPRQALAEHATWLLLVDDHGLGAQLADRLRQAQHSVVTVRRADTFAQLAEDAFTINPADRSAYNLLWRALAMTPQKVIHLWNVSETADPTLVDSFYSLLYLSQTIDEAQVRDQLDLFIVANQLHNVTGSDVVQPTKATLLAPTRVLPQEYATINCRALDVAWSNELASALDRPDAAKAELIVAQLLNEFATDPATMRADAPVVAYRGQRRWLAAVEPIHLPASAIPVRSGGVYVITEGLGEIGLALAEALAPWQPKLVLLGHASLPTRELWGTWLTSYPAQDATSHKIHALQRIEAMGAEVAIWPVDLTDGAAMQQTLAQVVAQFGTIHGVIHAAGLLPSALPMSQVTPAAAAQVFAPKMDGTRALVNGLATLTITPLDFMVLCSSLDAVLGGFGRMTYSAANAFVGAFAQQQAARQQLPYPVLTIDWDVWANLSTKTSQAKADPSANNDMIADLTDTATDGANAFLKVLGSGLAQVMVSVYDLELIMKNTRTQESLQMLAAPPTEAPTQARPEMGIAYAPPQTPVEQWLAAIWQSHLGIVPLGRDDDFFEHLAGQSLSAIGLINRIQDGLGALVQLQVIFATPTIGQMASYLQTNYAAALTQLGLLDRGIDNELAQPMFMPNQLPTDAATPALDPSAMLNQLDQLSEAELDAALAALLEEQA